jgi:hypothetical protein
LYFVEQVSRAAGREKARFATGPPQRQLNAVRIGTFALRAFAKVVLSAAAGSGNGIAKLTLLVFSFAAPKA